VLSCLGFGYALIAHDMFVERSFAARLSVGETVIKTADYYETGYKVYIGPQRYFVTSDVGDGRIQWVRLVTT